MSEFAFINRIRTEAARRATLQSDVVCGIGDDAAIVRERDGRELLITTDLLVEDVDFKLSYAPPHWLGHKALAVSLSDIAAMGGAPRHSLLTLAIPNRLQTSDDFWTAFLDGYFALAEQHGVDLIGGDISSTSGPLTIDSIVLGECSAGRAVRRTGARVGDAIYLTGSLGASAAGLKLLLLGAQVYEHRDDAVQTALRAHLRPEPRVVFGRHLGERGLAHAMIDVSDGLAQDLAHICDESDVGAVLDLDTVPVADEVALVVEDREAAFGLAVSGGEDYELLFTASGEDESTLLEISRACQLRLTRVGEILDEPGRLCLRRNGKTEPLTVQGFDHFAV
jgi:thiamine-monophosphate kinase